MNSHQGSFFQFFGIWNKVSQGKQDFYAFSCIFQRDFSEPLRSLQSRPCKQVFKFIMYSIKNF